MYFFLIFVVLIVALLIYSFTYWKRRAKRLENIAYKIGFNFKKIDNDLKNTEINRLKRFVALQPDKLADTSLFNVLSKNTNDFNVYIFDYFTRDPDRKSAPMFHGTYVCINSEDFEFPKFNLDPKPVLPNSFNIDDYPIFNKRYALSGSKENKVLELFSTNALNYFSRQDNMGWSIEANGKWICMTKNQKFGPVYRIKPVKPDQINDFYNICSEIYYLFTNN